MALFKIKKRGYGVEKKEVKKIYRLIYNITIFIVSINEKKKFFFFKVKLRYTLLKTIIVLIKLTLTTKNLIASHYFDAPKKN